MRRGWGVVAVAAGVLIAGLVYSGARGEAVRGPVAGPNPDAVPPAIISQDGVLRVTTLEPAELLLLDTLDKPGDADLLWFAGKPTQPYGEGRRIMLDAAGGPLIFNPRLRAERLHFRLEGRDPVSVVSDGKEGYWVATLEGSVLHLNVDGDIIDSLAQPFNFTMLASDGADDIVAFRSPENFAFPFGVEPPPLFVTVSSGREYRSPPARIPELGLMSDLVNAGRVVLDRDGSVYYAPFIRDEVIKLDSNGDTVWVASRGLEHEVLEPKFELINGKPELDYAPVNLGLAIDRNGLVYVLSTPAATTASSRLDVIDPDSGIVRRTARLESALPTLAVDGEGRVYLLDEFTLLTGVGSKERDSFQSFDLESIKGGRVSLADMKGRVTLINFWASWCAPCRIEMPALDTLRRDLEAYSPDFAFLAISDDVQPKKARAFIDEYGFDFDVLFGRGDMKSKYHYLGLPFTVVVDRQGNEVARWVGFAGENQIDAIRATVRAELDRGRGESASGSMAGMSGMKMGETKQ